MLFTLGMKFKEMDRKFQEGVKLWNSGKTQECVDIWIDLCVYGHLDSIEQLFYIFLDQKDFEEAASFIDCAKNPNVPIILYLKARLIEERDGLDAAIESFKAAAEAGNPNSCLFMFEVSIEQQNIEDAKIFLTRLAKHSEYLGSLANPTSYEELKEKVEELIAKIEAAEESEFHDDYDDDELELDGSQSEEWVEVIEAFVSGDDNEIQEVQDTYPRTFEAFMNLRECGLFEIWAEWSANLEFGRGEEETMWDFLSIEYLEDENGDEIDYDGERQRLSLQEEYLPSSDDDRYVFNIEGGVCAISGKAPQLFLESDVEIESKILRDVSGIDCQLHESSDDCYNNKCEASLITIGSGLGDGYYRAAAFDNLSGDIECVMTYFSYNWEHVESKLIFGKGTIGTKSNGTLIGNLENHIPVYLGEIKSDGSLNFGDKWAWSEAGRGEDFKIVSISVPADEYLVLGWIEALSLDPNNVRVFSVGLYRGEMKQYYLNLMEEFPVIKTFADEHLACNRNLGDY
jgi:hypothetical protein